MKNLMIFAMFIFCLVAAQFTFAQTADEVVDKYINAIGGKEKMMAMKTLKMEGAINVQGFDVSIVNTVSHGIGIRTDISVPSAGDGFQIATPTKGWEYMPFQGQTAPEEISEDKLKAAQSSLDLQSPLLNYKEKGHKVELLGKEKVGTADCFKLKLVNKNGKETTYFIDAETGYRVKSLSKADDGSEAETTYSDFKKTADGYVFAYSMTNARGTTVFSNIQVNIPVDEKIFKPE